jgi:hypothetical protein
MKVHKLAMIIATMALGAAPALALASDSGEHLTGASTSTPNGPPATTPASPAATTPLAPPATNHGAAHKSSTPGPAAGLPAKAKAYGRRCQGQSKTHVAGTPFSKCVTDMAKLANGVTKNPHTACKDLSKKHVAGQHGTPFSQCVSAGAKLLKDKAAS